MIVAIVNQKGGVAKTTTAINLAAALAKKRKKVLLVDLDPQANATSGLGLGGEAERLTVYDGLLGEAEGKDLVLATARNGLFLMPSSVELAAAEQVLAAEDDRVLRLRRLLDPLREDYDYIYIDCPPSLGLLTVNALTAADELLVPVQAEYYALEGLSQLIQTVQKIRTSTNPSLDMGGFLLTMVDSRMRLARQVVDNVRASLGERVFKTVIPRNVRLSEAPSFGQSIIDYEPMSKGARAYNALAKEVLNRDKGKA